jgi:hypothetical protein
MEKIIYCKKDPFVVLIDDEDDHIFMSLKWKIDRFHNDVYATPKGADGKIKYTALSREIMKCPKGLVVDHINGNRFDNRKKNLRICTQSLNSKNQKISKNNKAGYKGVYLDKRQNLTKRWVAQIKINRIHKKIGFFITAEEAARAYDLYAKKAWGEFANLNIKE